MEKSMEARRDGLVGVFQTLAKQHGEAAALMERVKDDSAKRESLWPKIMLALVSHEKGELKAVYPELARHEALKPFVEQHAKEAGELSAMIERLDKMSMDGREWGSLFSTLASTVLAHANEEESEIFPIALNAIGVDKAKDLDDAFKAAHKQVETSLKKTQH